LRKRFFDIVIGVLIGIGSSYYADMVYLEMRQEGLTPSLPFTQTDQNGEYRATEIYLVPFTGFEEKSSHMLAKALSEDTGLKITSTGSIALPEKYLNIERNQYNVDYLNAVVSESIVSLKNTKNNQLFIAIMKQDMYSGSNSWNFSLASNFTNNISIVATERLVPFETTNRSRAEQIFGERVYKILKRTIGLQYYKHPRKTDKDSVLFSPIMSVKDLDRMKYGY
jgi:predicted Zn-dependent protease